MCRPRGRVIPTPVVPQKPVSTFIPDPHPLQPAAPIPLTSVSIDVIIRDFVASTTLTQTFKNVESQPIEAIYQFPLEEKYTITDFAAHIDGKIIKGTVQEKEEAKNTYDDAIASGGGAYLLEKSETDPNIFSVNIGNLPPSKEVQIKITYVSELEFNPDGQLQFMISSSKSSDKNASSFRSDSASTVKYGMKVELKMTSNIRQLSSPSHPISFEFGEEPNQATVTLGSEGANQEKDFILYTKLAKPHEPIGRVAKDKSGNLSAMVALYPQLKLGEDEDIFTEMIFVVDRSGSMAGSRINQVRDTLLIFLRSLGEGTMFNIVGFGTRCEFLFKTGSVEYNEKNLDTATKHVRDLKANLGGTNILKPLQEILSKPAIEGYPRQLFILTDGEVNNTSECVQYVRKHSDTTRVFTFGIGGEASQELVKGMAKAGEGAFEFVIAGESMEDKVMKQLNKAMQPALTDIKIHWGGEGAAAAQQSPYRLPPLFVGGRMVVYGFLPPGTKLGGEGMKVTLTAVAGGTDKKFETSVQLQESKIENEDLIHKLGARSLIKDLEEKRSYLHTREGDLLPGKADKDVKAEVIRLSCRYGVLSKHTAFVAVEERDEATEGTMVARKFGVSIDKPSSASLPTPSSVPKSSISLPPPPASYGSTNKSMAPPPARASGPSVSGAMPRSSSISSSSVSSLSYPAPLSSKSSAPMSMRDQSMDMEMRRSSEEGSASKDKAKRKKSSASPKLLSLGKKNEDKKEKKEKSDSSSMSRMRKSESAPSPPSQYSAGPQSHSMQQQQQQLQSNFSSAPTPSPIALSSPSSSLLAPSSPRLSKCESNNNNNNYERAQLDSINLQMDDDEAEEEPAQKAPPPAALKSIIMQQKASGAWALGDVGSLLGGKLDAGKIKGGIPKLESAVTGDVELLWVTAVVAAYLQAAFPGESTNWTQVVNKASRYIAKQKKALGVKPDIDWKAEAEKFVKANL